MAKNNPESRQAEDTNKTEVSQITKTVKPTTVVPTPEAEPVGGYDTIKMVDRTRKSDSPEAARQKNNRTRDMRTNLGRGKASDVVVD
jgi:hypothetical protein